MLRNLNSETPRGFTLIELLVVIAIIGILSAVVLASLNTARERSRNTSYVAQIREYQKALALHYSAQGSYPGNSTWGCVGTGYPGGVCWNSAGYNESNTTAVAFRAAVSPYIDASKVPGPTDRVYGPMYRPAGSGYEFILMLEGDVTCPIGTKIVDAGAASQNLTRCNITSQGL